MRLILKGKRFTVLLFTILSLNLIHSATAFALEKKQINWAGCGISKLGFMKDLAAAYEKKTGIKINLEGGGAKKGIRQTATGKIDLGGSCRLPLIIKNKNGTYTVDSAEHSVKMIPVGWDALVVIVNKNNQALNSIPREQLKDVLTGKITNWKQLGASIDKPINLYIRKGKLSGVGLTLRQQLFNNRNQSFSPDATILPSSGKIEKAVEEDPYGLAVSGISSSRHRQVKMLELDGVEPTITNLKAGKYKLLRILFLVAPTNFEERPELKQFVDFSLSPTGQRIIEKAGTLPYHRGIHLIYTTASHDYLNNINIVEQAGIYTLSYN